MRRLPIKTLLGTLIAAWVLATPAPAAAAVSDNCDRFFCVWACEDLDTICSSCQAWWCTDLGTLMCSGLPGTYTGYCGSAT